MWVSFPSERIHRTLTGSDLTWHLKAIVIMGTFVSIYISLWSVQATAQISQIFLGVHYHDYFNKYMLYGCRLHIPLTHKIGNLSPSVALAAVQQHSVMATHQANCQHRWRKAYSICRLDLDTGIMHAGGDPACQVGAVNLCQVGLF